MTGPNDDGAPRTGDAGVTQQGGGHHGGMPGDGAGRAEAPGHTGVHPASAGWPPGDMDIRRQGEWGQGERGLEGYEDSGESEITWLPGELEGAGEGSALTTTPETEARAAEEEE